MDRRDFAVCAGLFVSIAAVCSGGCGGQSAPAPTSHGPAAPLASSVASSEASRSARRPEPAQVIAPVCDALVPRSAPLEEVASAGPLETHDDIATPSPVSVAAPQAAAEHSVPHSTAQELNRSTVPLSVGVVGRGSELKFTVAGSQPEPVAAEEVADTAENTVESAVEA